MQDSRVDKGIAKVESRIEKAKTKETRKGGDTVAANSKTIVNEKKCAGKGKAEAAPKRTPGGSTAYAPVAKTKAGLTGKKK